MSRALLQKQLQKHLNKTVELVVHENRFTMLNVLKSPADRFRLSLHKMFLDAPDYVMHAVIRFVCGRSLSRDRDSLTLRGYIQSNLSRFDARSQLDPKKLIQKGKVYHLDTLFHALNQQYFEGKLELNVTWFGHQNPKARFRVTLGSYTDHLRLIKVHRLLDHSRFPRFFVDYILFHEMLHATVPGKIDTQGRFCVHHAAFKEQERRFRYYKQALLWEKHNKQFFFR